MNDKLYMYLICVLHVVWLKNKPRYSGRDANSLISKARPKQAKHGGEQRFFGTNYNFRLAPTTFGVQLSPGGFIIN